MLGVAASGQNVGFAIISEHATLSTRASALDLKNAMIILFGAILPPLVSLFIYPSLKITHFTAHDFTMGFTFLPILNFLAICIAIFFIQETYGKPQKEPIILQTKSSSP